MILGIMLVNNNYDERALKQILDGYKQQSRYFNAGLVFSFLSMIFAAMGIATIFMAAKTEQITQTLVVKVVFIALAQCLSVASYFYCRHKFCKLLKDKN